MNVKQLPFKRISNKVLFYSNITHTQYTRLKSNTLHERLKVVIPITATRMTTLSVTTRMSSIRSNTLVHIRTVMQSFRQKTTEQSKTHANVKYDSKPGTPEQYSAPWVLYKYCMYLTRDIICPRWLIDVKAVAGGRSCYNYPDIIQFIDEW